MLLPVKDDYLTLVTMMQIMHPKIQLKPTRIVKPSHCLYFIDEDSAETGSKVPHLVREFGFKFCSDSKVSFYSLKINK